MCFSVVCVNSTEGSRKQFLMVDHLNSRGSKKKKTLRRIYNWERSFNWTAILANKTTSQSMRSHMEGEKNGE